jgi:hypothetical protein
MEGEAEAEFESGSPQSISGPNFETIVKIKTEPESDHEDEGEFILPAEPQDQDQEGLPEWILPDIKEELMDPESESERNRIDIDEYEYEDGLELKPSVMDWNWNCSLCPKICQTELELSRHLITTHHVHHDSLHKVHPP